MTQATLRLRPHPGGLAAYHAAGAACRRSHWPLPTAIRFKSIYEAEWAFRLREFPMYASYVGVHDFDDRMGHVSESDQARRHAFWQDIRRQLDGISCERLARDECVNYRIFVQQMDNFIAAYETRSYLIPFNSDSGFFMEWARLPDDTDFNRAEDYRAYLARLHELPDVMDEYIGLMRTGVAEGFTQPRVILEGRDEPIKAQVVESPRDSPFFGPFLQIAGIDCRWRQGAIAGDRRAGHRNRT